MSSPQMIRMLGCFCAEGLFGVAMRLSCSRWSEGFESRWTLRARVNRGPCAERPIVIVRFPQERVRVHRFLAAVIGCLLGCLLLSPVYSQAPQAPASDLVTHLQERLQLSDQQVRGGLGVLLVFARQRLPQTQFDE